MRLLLALLAFFCFTASSELHAAALTPGIYRLDWEMPTLSENSDPLTSNVSFGGEWFQPYKSKSLKSSNAFEAVVGLFHFIVDESKGTGKGYDTLYIAQKLSTEPKGELDLTKAVKVPVSEDRGRLYPVAKDGIKVDIEIGETGSKVTKQVIFYPAVRLRDIKEGMIPALLMYQAGGSWTGKVKTEDGELSLQSLDANANGVCGDRMSGVQTKGDEDIFSTDAIAITAKDKTSDFPSKPELIYLNDAALYRGKLYDISVSAIGDTVGIRPYEGSTGKVTINAVDGQGRKAYITGIRLTGDKRVYDLNPELNDPTGTTELPTGDYTIRIWQVELTKTPKLDGGIDLVLGGKEPLHVQSTADNVLKLGGPLSMRVGNDTAIKAKAGSTIRIPIKLSLGNYHVLSFANRRDMTIQLKDSKGKAVYSGKTIPFDIIESGYQLKVPSKLKQGTYNLVVTLDPRPYQNQVVAKRSVSITR